MFSFRCLRLSPCRSGFAALSWLIPVALILWAFSLPTFCAQTTAKTDFETETPDPFGEIGRVVESHIGLGNLPGAVVLIGHQDSIIFERAFGNRSVEPELEAMTTDTVFDLASLTKVVATAPSIMLLVQKGLLNLDEPVSKYLPAFGQSGKKNVTVRQLLVHYSGLPAALRQTRRRRITSKNALSRIYQTRLVAPPGQRFIYSDLGFVVLGKIVEKVTGQSLSRFAEGTDFLALGDGLRRAFFPALMSYTT